MAQSLRRSAKRRQRLQYESILVHWTVAKTSEPMIEVPSFRSQVTVAARTVALPSPTPTPN